jgi:hypothetical protein
MAEKIWWEKTVEYTYVRDLGIGDFAAPFDGNEEQMGDAVMKRENRWLLIEFKRTAHQFSSERKKYPKGRCDTYLKGLWVETLKYRWGQIDGSCNEPHYFVYGTHVIESTNADPDQVSISACPYWGSWAKAGWIDSESDKDERQAIQETFAGVFENRPNITVNALAGVRRDHFDEYVKLALWAKAGKESVSSGGYAMVVGISPEGKPVASLSLEEYATDVLGCPMEPDPDERPAPHPASVPTP